jgi:hypothetical protein
MVRRLECQAKDIGTAVSYKLMSVFTLNCLHDTAVTNIFIHKWSSHPSTS